MRNTVKCFRLIKYTLRKKLWYGLIIGFFVVGLLFEFTDYTRTGSWSLGAMYFALTPIYFFQMVFNLSVSNMLKASPMKRELEVKGPFLITLCTGMISFILYAVIRFLRVTPQFIETTGVSYAKAYSPILFLAYTFSIFLIYSSFSYKFYYSGIVFIVIVFFPMLFLISENDFFLMPIAEKTVNGSNPILLILVAAGIIFVGFIIAYIISLKVYRRETSEVSVRFALRSVK